MSLVALVVAVSYTHLAEALKLGYRSIDTAQYYRNEAGVGAAVKESGLPREGLFITTKAMTTGYRATKLGIDNSLTEAGLDYFDLMLIHWPMQDLSLIHI